MSKPNHFKLLNMELRLVRPSLLLAIAAAFILVGCGTTSGLQSTGGVAVGSTRKFSKVTVQDFKLSLSEHAEEASSTRIAFADVIASEIKKTSRFSVVNRNTSPDSDTLIIDGVITKYDEGSTQKRIWLGMGFGMAFLEATVNFGDSKGNRIGVIKVDKNSWPLGGGLAAGQNPHSFMNGAADKIAEEAAKLAR